jgi:hypothetical protein
MFMNIVAAATAALDADLFNGEVWARSPVNRVLTGIGCRGSAAAADFRAEIYIDEVRVGQFINVNTGVPNNDDIAPLEDLAVPAGAQLRAIVRDAATTNPVHTLVAFEDVE